MHFGSKPESLNQSSYSFPEYWRHQNFNTNNTRVKAVFMSIMSSKTEKLIRSLVDLENFNNDNSKSIHPSHTKIEALLDLIFDIGREKLIFTEEDRKILGPLLLNAINPIQLNIGLVDCEYRTYLGHSVLRKRSALQFLIEDYGDLVVEEGTTLSQKLAALNIQKSISILDDIISNWRDISDSDEPQPKHITTGIPESHIWWSS